MKFHQNAQGKFLLIFILKDSFNSASVSVYIKEIRFLLRVLTINENFFLL